MKLKSSRSSRLFLIELIIAVLFFSLGSAVCVQAFARAHSASMEARDLAFASSTVSGAANVVRYGGGDLEGFQQFFPEAFAEGEGFALCYDSSFAPCAPAEAAYILRVETEEAERVILAHIRMDDREGETLYELELRYPAAA